MRDAALRRTGSAVSVTTGARSLIAVDHDRWGNKHPQNLIWWVPDLREQDEGRDDEDPDILSWQIPRLEWNRERPRSQLPKSTKSGAATTVYFANLAQGPARVKKVLPKGSRSTLSKPLQWSDGTNEIPNLFVSETGAVPAGMVNLGHSGQIKATKAKPWVEARKSHIGALYYVEIKVGGEWKSAGTYTVNKPPARAVKYQVAEIHGHFEGDGNDGILDPVVPYRPKG
jgi:hypothetical protein